MPFSIYPVHTKKLKGRNVYETEPIACRLCGSTTSWMPEVDAKSKNPRSFICRHEPIAGRLPHFDSVGIRDVHHWDYVSFGSVAGEDPLGNFWALVDAGGTI